MGKLTVIPTLTFPPVAAWLMPVKAVEAIKVIEAIQVIKDAETE